MIPTGQLNKVSDLAMHYSAQQKILMSEKLSLINDLSSLDEYLDNYDEVTNLLQALLQESQKSTITLYENLLTELVQDVMPGNSECSKVRLTVFFKSVSGRIKG